MQPLVSIIIPTYNSKKYLKETVNSALNQTYKLIEIIVIDDGSTDGTETMFTNFEKQGIACYRVKNGGASSARNYGLSKANGDYIQFLDADDILHESKIEKQLQLMQLHDADICYSPWIDFKVSINDYQDEFKFSRLDHGTMRTGKELMSSFGMDNWFINTLSWLVKRDIVDKAGLWDVDIINNNDGEYFSRVLFYAIRVVCCNEHLAYYRRTPNSLGKLNSVLKIEASFNSYQKIETLLCSCNDVKLMSYPKRMYYMQYKRIKKNYPNLAKRAAKNFDRIKAPSFLSKKKYYWIFINRFGLYNGTKLYTFLQPIWGLLKRN
ncbi:glycosyltransferase family 2 protein [Winogradskyella bathintestinalis]|uniref:Glycosyltransferase family 2 protein n=1 Tax=Winogradskyella bathintestinalis TaxID=3035208 RepID=A0ABT7ZTW0_9FLAO|nr:glycosyltransferase family 2 protein [Winogradskyella bathintestinalis]MDN3492430.1 glycosyltransferase family 2 protein [Winogradskyella bathintestinalis]